MEKLLEPLYKKGMGKFSELKDNTLKFVDNTNHEETLQTEWIHTKHRRSIDWHCCRFDAERREGWWRNCHCGKKISVIEKMFPTKKKGLCAAVHLRNHFNAYLQWRKLAILSFMPVISYTHEKICGSPRNDCDIAGETGFGSIGNQSKSQCSAGVSTCRLSFRSAT